MALQRMVSLDDQYSPEELKKIAQKKQVVECVDCGFMFIDKEEDGNDCCPFCFSPCLKDVRMR